MKHLKLLCLGSALFLANFALSQVGQQAPKINKISIVDIAGVAHFQVEMKTSSSHIGYDYQYSIDNVVHNTGFSAAPIFNIPLINYRNNRFISIRGRKVGGGGTVVVRAPTELTTIHDVDKIGTLFPEPIDYIDYLLDLCMETETMVVYNDVLYDGQCLCSTFQSLLTSSFPNYESNPPSHKEFDEVFDGPTSVYEIALDGCMFYDNNDGASNKTTIVTEPTAAVYPNPANASDNLVISTNKVYGKIYAELFDLTGKVLLAKSIQNTSMLTLDLSTANAESGVYIVRLHDEQNNLIVNRKVIVN